MKKVLALVLAVIMVCTMAMAVTITGDKTIVAGSGSDEFAGVTVTNLTPGESIIFTVKDLFDTNYYTVDSNTVTGGKKFVPANNKVTVNYYAGKALVTEGWQMIDPDGEETADNYQYVITVKEDLTKALDSKVDLVIKSISVKATGKNPVDVAKAVSGKNYTKLTVDGTETIMVFDVGYAKGELTINGNGTVALEEVELNTIYTIKAGKDSKDKDVTTGKWTDGTRTLAVNANGTLIKKSLAYVGDYVDGTVLKDVKAEKVLFNSRNQYSVPMTSFVENAKASYNAYAIKGDGSVAKLSATLDDGVLTFTMPAFSYVVVVDGTLATTATEPATPGTTTNPGTGANDVVGVAAALAVVALVSGAAISLKK